MTKISTDLLFRKEFRIEWTDSGRQIGSWTCGRWDRTGKQKNLTGIHVCRMKLTKMTRQ